MSRSRVQLRERLHAPVETSDPQGLASYAAELRPVVASLRELAEDATARPSQRVRCRALLRREMLKGLRALETRLDVADPPEHADPAGLGGAGPVA